MPVEQLLASLSIRNRDGDIPLIKTHVFKKAFPQIEKLLDQGKGFETVLLTPNKEGSIPLKAFILAVFSLKSPLPKEFLKVFECFLTILSKQVKESELYRFIYDSFESNFFNLLNALPSDQQVPLLATFLSISDKEGKTPLQSEDVLKNVVLLGQSLSIEQLLTILSIQDKEGLLLQGSLHSPEGFEKAIPLLKNLSPEQLKVILSMQSKEGKTPLHNPEVFEKAIPLLQDLQSRALVGILTIMDKIGETLLVKPDVFEKAIPFLQKLPPEKLAAVFYFKVNFGPLFSNTFFV